MVVEYLCGLPRSPREPECHTLSIDSPAPPIDICAPTIKIEQTSISLLNTSLPLWGPWSLDLCVQQHTFLDRFPKPFPFRSPNYHNAPEMTSTLFFCGGRSSSFRYCGAPMISQVAPPYGEGIKRSRVVMIGWAMEPVV